MTTNEDNQHADAIFIPNRYVTPTPKKGQDWSADGSGFFSALNIYTGPRRWRCCTYKNAFYVFLFLIVALIIVVLVLGILYRQLRGPAWCPDDWIAHHGKCYYFSKEEKNWTSSQEFCTSHGAFLANIEPGEEDFMTRLRGKDIYWIGLSRDQSRSWKWTNGDIFMMEVMGQDGGDCAYLNDEFKPSTSRCFQEHRWICKKVGMH